MKKSKIIGLISIVLILFFLANCSWFTNVKSSLVITSVNEKTFGDRVKTTTNDKNITRADSRYIDDTLIKYWFENAGPADYLKIIVKKITLIADTEELQAWEIWAGEQEITLDGSGVLNTNFELDNSMIPLDIPLKTIVIELDSRAKVKGSLIDKVYQVSDATVNENREYEIISVATKSLYYLDQISNPDDFVVKNSITGAEETPDYTAYNTVDGSDAEEAIIQFYSSETVTFETNISHTIHNGDTITFTFLTDLSRVLRFNNGCGYGHAAYFFANRFTPKSFACFIGEIGKVQGYEIVYNEEDNLVYGNKVYHGWISLTLNPANELMFGTGIADEYYPCPSGNIENFLFDPGTQTFSFDIIDRWSNGDSINHITGFKILSNNGDMVSGRFEKTDDTVGGEFLGKCDITLNMIYP